MLRIRLLKDNRMGKQTSFLHHLQGMSVFNSSYDRSIPKDSIGTGPLELWKTLQKPRRIYSLEETPQNNSSRTYEAMLEVRTYEQPGGGIMMHNGQQVLVDTPVVVKEHQRQGTAEGYKMAAKNDGIPFREKGLFPPGDDVLMRLCEDPHSWPFEKHLPGLDSPYQLLRKGGWVNGEHACSHGIDLRLFYKEKMDGSEEKYGTVVGAVRLGEGAAIGSGFWLSAHGGAVETILDEATAEMAKIDFTPFVSTRQISFDIVKPVPLHETLLVECRITKQKGLRCWVDGQIVSSDGFTILATCTALLIDMRPFIKD